MDCHCRLSCSHLQGNTMNRRLRLERLYVAHLQVRDALLKHAQSRLGEPWPIIEALEASEPRPQLRGPLTRVRQGVQDPWDLLDVGNLCFLTHYDRLPILEEKAGVSYACEMNNLRRAGHLRNLQRWRNRVCHPRVNDLCSQTFHTALEQLQAFLDRLQGPEGRVELVMLD